MAPGVPKTGPTAIFVHFPASGMSPSGDIESLAAMRYVVPTRTAFVETKAHLLF
jgi:hypothetical protein